MSYLLDALRKSESERRIGEIPKLTAELTIPSGPRKLHALGILITALVLINLGTLLYFTFSDPIPPEKAPENPPHSSTEIPPPPGSAEKVEPDIPAIPAIPAKQEPVPAPRSAAKPGVAGTMPFQARPAEIEIRSPPSGSGVPKPSGKDIQKSRAAIKSADTAPEPPVPMNAIKSSTDLGNPDSGRDRPSAEEPSPIPEMATVSEPADRAAEPIPLLADLPRDFQRDLPTLSINVFVYSEIPEERFVIVNMSKYLIGQKIDGGPEILDIGPDTLVLEYRGRKFRVKRP